MFSILCRSIKRESNIWKLHILLRKIINFVLSPEVVKDDLTEFESDCRLFNHQFSRLFSGNTPFKVHNIDHYAEATEDFGCLFYYSTMRYERVHQLMKKFVQSSQNYTSLPQQICYKWVVVNLIKFNENRQEKQDDILEIYDNNSYENGDLPERFLQFIDQSRECIALKSFMLNGTLIEDKNIYLYKRYNSTPPNHFPIFVRIVAILKQAETKILARFITCSKYYERIQAFEVHENQDLRIIDKVEWHKSIKVINASNSYLILQNFYVPYEYQTKYTNSNLTAFNNDEQNLSYSIELTDNPSNLSDEYTTESDEN